MTLPAFLLLLLAPPLGAQEDAKLADELREAVRALREERAAAYARRRTRAAEIEAARAPIRRLDSDVAELKLKEEEADKGLLDVQSELAQLKAAAAAEKAVGQALAPELDATAAFLKDFVRQGLPYRQNDRLARLGDGGTPAERVSRAWAFAQEELRIARSGESYTADVALSGNRVKPARLFRTGHLLLGYVTEDGAESGLWKKGGWTPDENPSIRQAVEMLDRRRPPGLLLFPVERRAAK